MILPPVPHSQFTRWCRWITPRGNDPTPESLSRGFGPGGSMTMLIADTLGDWWWQDPARFLGELGERLVSDA